MFKDVIKLIPHAPGSYQYKNKDGIVIYVGKAKDLKNRVSSYFIGTKTGKTAVLVSEIAQIEYIVTNSELEAFILEINLIKELMPKYNILLKDDKSYPYIEYINKPYPKLKIVRYLNIKKQKNRYLFGPYPNAYSARRIVNLLNRLYPLKKCDSMPKKVCLYYHIGECLGYCQKDIDNNKVLKMEKDILSFLKGDDKIIKNKLIEKINSSSKQLNYELSLELKKELDYINIVLEKQQTFLNDLKDRDIINYYYVNNYLSIQFLFIRNGKLIASHHDIIPIINDLKDELETYIINFYLKNITPQEIIVNQNLDANILSDYLGIKVITVLKGQKKKLLDMALINAKIHYDNNFESIKRKEERTIKANEELKKLLELPKLDRIDLFDNSNLFGKFTVSGMIVFKNGLPAKKEYRKYKMSFDKNDDVLAMKEVVYRRYFKMLLENLEKPDLIIVDGGLNQINATLSVLKELDLNIKVCGLKKDNHHQTNVLIDNQKEYVIEKNSNLFNYIAFMQDEVHRYTINYHKQIRSKGSLSSVLDEVKGLGPKRKKELITKYNTINNIKKAKTDELEKILPFKVAEELIKYLNR